VLPQLLVLWQLVVRARPTAALCSRCAGKALTLHGGQGSIDIAACEHVLPCSEQHLTLTLRCWCPCSVLCGSSVTRPLPCGWLT
jgi:hypothetical protein